MACSCMEKLLEMQVTARLKRNSNECHLCKGRYISNFCSKGGLLFQHKYFIDMERTLKPINSRMIHSAATSPLGNGGAQCYHSLTLNCHVASLLRSLLQFRSSHISKVSKAASRLYFKCNPPKTPRPAVHQSLPPL